MLPLFLGFLVFMWCMIGAYLGGVDFTEPNYWLGFSFVVASFASFAPITNKDKVYEYFKTKGDK